MTGTGTGYCSPQVGAEPVEQLWTCIAAESDGEVDAGAIGQRTLERCAVFAFRAEADAFAHELHVAGFEVTALCPCATRYFGPTDSPSNAWSVRGERVLVGRIG